MLTSLLTLYIASSLQPGLTAETFKPEEANTSVVKMASSKFSSIIETESMPIKNPTLIAPIIEARSSIVLDLASGQTLFEKNPHQRMPIASITKLMTILIILEENQLNEVATISNNAANTEGSQMHLRKDEQISVENLLYGAMVHSANDAAVALAEHNSGNVEKFVEKMNQRALDLGLVNTRFSNPIGLDEVNNYSSANDIARLGSFAYHSDFIKKAAQVKELDVKSADGQYTHHLESTNDLLGNEYFKIKGLKTGQTDAAGLCLVSVAENKQGNEILTVVLNSPARFKETKILVDWIFRAFNWAQQ